MPKTLAIAITLALIPTWAAGAANTQLQVKLFGQPCTLQGPTTDDVLRAIHAVSPEQVIPILESEDLRESGIAKVQKSLGQLREQKSVPSQLDRYREQLIRRLEAYRSYIEGVLAARANRSPEVLVKTVRKHLKGATKAAKRFEAEVKRMPPGPLSAEAALKLLDLYGDAIEPDPEEEFHRSIRRMNVRYVCTFDESTPPPTAEEPPSES